MAHNHGTKRCFRWIANALLNWGAEWVQPCPRFVISSQTGRVGQATFSLTHESSQIYIRLT